MMFVSQGAKRDLLVQILNRPEVETALVFCASTAPTRWSVTSRRTTSEEKPFTGTRVNRSAKKP